MTIAFETTDVDSAHAILSTMYGVRRLNLPGRQTLVRLRQRTLGPVGLHRLTLMMTSEIDGAPLDVYYLGHIISGTATYQRSRTYVAGDVFLTDQPEVPFHGVVDHVDIEFATLGAEVFARVAATAPTARPGPIRLTGFQPSSPRDTRLWLDTYTYVRDTIAGLAEPVQPLLVDAAVQLLAAAALATFPNNAIADPTIEDRHDAHPDSLRRAIAFIDENAYRDISVADIAAAAYVTIRAVQLAFRRHLDTTPLAYLRRVRLEYAHRDLQTADPASTTISAVAARWGFLDHSRFTAIYRDAYGTTPSQTLRGRPPIPKPADG